MVPPQPPTEIPAAIFNFFMLLLLWRFSLRLLRRPHRHRTWISESPSARHLAAPPEKSPLEIAQERYAQGDIGDKEFEEIVEHLLKSRSPSQDW